MTFSLLLICLWLSTASGAFCSRERLCQKMAGRTVTRLSLKSKYWNVKWEKRSIPYFISSTFDPNKCQEEIFSTDLNTFLPKQWYDRKIAYGRNVLIKISSFCAKIIKFLTHHRAERVRRCDSGKSPRSYHW